MKNNQAALSDLDKLVQHGKSKLHLAVEAGDISEVLSLLERGASVNLKTSPPQEFGEKNKTPLGLVMDKMLQGELPLEDETNLENIKCLLLDYGADRYDIGDFLKKSKQIQKELINKKIVANCAGEDIRLKGEYEKFYKFLQGKFNAYITKLKATTTQASEQGSLSVHSVIPQIKLINKVLNFFSGYQEVKDSANQATGHFINNAHIDEVGADYCARAVKYYKREVVEPNEDTGVITKYANLLENIKEHIGNEVLKVVSQVIGVSTEEIVQSHERQGVNQIPTHWEFLARICVLKFIGYINDRNIDYDCDLGIKAAKDIFPAWPQRLNIKGQDFTAENAYNIGSLAYLAYESKSKILEIAKEWGIEEGDCHVRQSNYLKSFVMYDGEKIIISFRGTYHHDVNWHRDDFNFPSTTMKVRDKKLSVHSGFYKALMSHWEEPSPNERPLKEIVREYYEKNQKAQIYITGHSLGAAMACVGYCQVLDLLQEISLNQVTLYTYGQPSWCDNIDIARDLFDNNYYRIINYLDPVPDLANLVGYKHFGPLYCLHKDGSLLNEADYYLLSQSLNKEGYREINDSNILAKAYFFQQHFMSNYFKKLFDIKSTAVKAEQARKGDLTRSEQVEPLAILDTVGNEGTIHERQFSTKAQKLKSKGLDQDLHLAAAVGDVVTIEDLINQGQDVNSLGKYRSTPLKIAVDNDQIQAALVLIKAGADINVRYWVNEQPLLCWAAERHSLEIIKGVSANQKAVDYSIKDNNGCTPLYLAVRSGATSIVRFFLEQKSIRESLDLEQEYEWGVTALWKAVKEGYLNIAELLIDNGANIEFRDTLGSRPLLEMAVDRGDIYMMKLLILKGAKYEPKEYCDMDEEGNSLLHLCAKYDYLEDLYLGIAPSFESEVFRKNKHGKTVEDLALEQGRIEILKHIWQVHKIDESLYAPEGHHQLAKGDTIKLLSKIYKSVNWDISIEEARNGIDINKVNNKGNTILYELALLVCTTPEEIKTKLEYMSKVIKGGCDVNLTKRINGFTPLHFAVSSNQENVVELLIAKGADIFIPNSFGKIALSIGLQYGYEKINNTIAKKIIQDKNTGMKSLIQYYKDGGGDVEVACFLHVKDPTLINMIDDDGRTVLHLAVMHNQQELVARIVNIKPQFINKPDWFGKSPLSYAQELGNTELTQILTANSSEMHTTSLTSIEHEDFTAYSCTNEEYKVTLNGDFNGEGWF